MRISLSPEIGRSRALQAWRHGPSYEAKPYPGGAAEGATDDNPAQTCDSAEIHSALCQAG